MILGKYMKLKVPINTKDNVFTPFIKTWIKNLYVLFYRNEIHENYRCWPDLMGRNNLS